MIDVTVVLPTYNRLSRLQQVLAGLEAQTYPRDRFEVVVVSDGSSDGTNEFLRQVETLLQLTPLVQPNQGAAAARNQGIAAATGNYILFVDDDVVPAPQLIQEHRRMHACHGDNIVVIGPMLSPPGFEMSPWVRWMQERLAEQYAAMVGGAWAPTARQFYTGNASLARAHLVAQGGFDTAFRRAEDVELAYRLAEKGIQFLFNPDAIGYHFEERSFASWMSIPYAYGRNDVIFSREKGQPWLLERVLIEFEGRHPLVRGLTLLCLDRPQITNRITALLHKTLLLGKRLNIPTVDRFACSCLFNLQHYQGIADEMGGRASFRAALEATEELLAVDISHEERAEAK